MKTDRHYTIERKDGITYDKTYHVYGFDCNMNFRYFKEKREKLKKIAKERGISYNELARIVLDAYIDSYEKLTKSE